MNNYEYNGYVYQDMMPLNSTLLNNNLFSDVAPTNVTASDTSIPNRPNLFAPREAFVKGNLFRNLYNQYKNFQPAPLSATTEQEQMYLELSQTSFAAHELNLYLDNYPNDITMIKLFNDYRNMANEALKRYEEKYGPVVISSDSLDKTPWQWATPFPWDEGGM